MKSKIFFFAVCFVFLSLFFPSARADKVFLSNGRVMEGIVEKEDQERLTLNLGVGSITIPREEVARIERSEGQQRDLLRDKWRKKYFSHSDFSPQRFKDLARDYNDLDRLRNEAVRERFQGVIREKKAKDVEARITELYTRYLEVNKQLSRSQPVSNEEINRHNLLVSESNALVAELKLCEQEQKDLAAEPQTSGNAVSLYRSALFSLRSSLDERVSGLEGMLEEEEEQFAGMLSAELEKLAEEFRGKNAPLRRRGNVMFVSAVLNGRVPAEFVLDTGASMVLLSEKVAGKLGVSKKEGESFWATLANGEKVKAYPVLLNSVDVSGMKAEQVQAAVLERSFPSDQDGLLGMSYLGNFLFQIDVKESALILETFSP